MKRTYNLIIQVAMHMVDQSIANHNVYLSAKIQLKSLRKKPY